MPTYANRIAPDASDLLVWMCDDASGSSTIANTGSLGSAGNLTVGSGLTLGCPAGIFGNCLFNPNTNSLATAQLAGAAGNEPASPTTWSGWFWVPVKSGSNNIPLLSKAYRPAASGWTNPWNHSLYIPTNTVSIGAALIVSAAQATLVSDGTSTQQSAPLFLARWHHIGMTYDGTTWKSYCDGDLIASVAKTGALDYGTHGPWFIGGGGLIAADADHGAMMIQDIRVATVARAQSWFQSVYATAYGLSA